MDRIKREKIFVEDKLQYIIYFVVFLIVLLVFVLACSNKEASKNLNSKLTLVLNGNETINIIKGDTYHEAGYAAHDSEEGDLTSKVVVKSNLDTKIIGNYEIRYTVSNSSGKEIQKIRKVNVIADLSDLKVSINYSPMTITNEDVTIKLKIIGDGYDFVLTPDGNITNNNEINYNVSLNDEYLFSIKRKDGMVIEKNIEIKNIDKKKPIGSCKNLIDNGKSKITVTAEDENGIAKYSYTVDGALKYQGSEATYTYEKSSSNVVVTAYDKAGNYQLLNCVTSYSVGAWPEDRHRDLKATTQGNFYQESTYGSERENYMLYYPKTIDLKEKNALVIFLGGGGEQSRKIEVIRGTAFGQNMKKGIFQGAIYLLPECHQGWEFCMSPLKTLIDEVVKKYNVDPNRISIMGHSHGGDSVFQMLLRYQGFFSSAVVLSGTQGPDGGSIGGKLKNTKITVYYGAKDSNISTARIRMSLLISKGANLKYIEFPNEGHTIQSRVINETNAIEWMIAQRRK